MAADDQRVLGAQRPPDFEFQIRTATQFGGSLMRSREGRGAPDTQPPNATQIRLSDGLNPFGQTGPTISIATDILL